MRVLLLSSQQQDKEFFEGAAKVAGFPLLLMNNPSQVCEEVAKSPDALIVVDVSTETQYKAFEKAIGDRFGLFSDTINPNGVFFVSAVDFQGVPHIAQSSLWGHFIPRTFAPENQGQIGRLFGVAAAAIQHAQGQGQTFAMERYFEPSVKVQTFKVTQSQQKKAIVDSLKNHLIDIGFKLRSATLISTAADELLMNAIFDAPVDAMNKYIYAQTPRNTALELTGRNVVEFKIAYDGKILGVGVQDQFGSLDKKKLLGHLGKSYESEEFKVRTNVAGAGLGLANVYRNCGGIVFECEVSAGTQVILFYKKTESFKEFKDQFRFLSTLMYFS